MADICLQITSLINYYALVTVTKRPQFGLGAVT